MDDLKDRRMRITISPCKQIAGCTNEKEMRASSSGSPTTPIYTGEIQRRASSSGYPITPDFQNGNERRFSIPNSPLPADGIKGSQRRTSTTISDTTKGSQRRLKFSKTKATQIFLAITLVYILTAGVLLCYYSRQIYTCTGEQGCNMLTGGKSNVDNTKGHIHTTRITLHDVFNNNTKRTEAHDKLTGVMATSVKQQQKDAIVSQSRPTQKNAFDTDPDRHVTTQIAKVTCKGDAVHLSATPLDRIALVSSPGSGNTWARHLIEQATGIATGSIYGDSELKAAGFIGESSCSFSNQCIVVKTHEWKTVYVKYFKKAILLIRHPHEAVVSAFHYLSGGRHKKEAAEASFKTDHWFRFAEERIRFWFELSFKWITLYEHSLHIVFYEDLKANPIVQTAYMVEFLNESFTKSDKTCLRRNIDGQFQREHKIKYDLKSIYNLTLTSQMDTYMRNLTQVLRKRFPEMKPSWK